MSKQEEIESKMKPQRNPYQAFEEEEAPAEGNENINVNANISEVDRVEQRYTSGSTGSKGKTSSDLVGIYFDPEVKKILNRKQSEKGRGWKSEFVNAAVIDALKNKGWVE